MNRLELLKASIWFSKIKKGGRESSIKLITCNISNLKKNNNSILSFGNKLNFIIVSFIIK